MLYASHNPFAVSTTRSYRKFCNPELENTKKIWLRSAAIFLVLGLHRCYFLIFEAVNFTQPESLIRCQVDCLYSSRTLFFKYCSVLPRTLEVITKTRCVKSSKWCSCKLFFICFRSGTNFFFKGFCSLLKYSKIIIVGHKWQISYAEMEV